MSGVARAYVLTDATDSNVRVVATISNRAEAATASAAPAPPSDGELANAVFKAQHALLAAWDAAQAAGLSVQHYADDSSSPWPHVYSIQRVFTPAVTPEEFASALGPATDILEYAICGSRDAEMSGSPESRLRHGRVRSVRFRAASLCRREACRVPRLVHDAGLQTSNG